MGECTYGVFSCSRASRCRKNKASSLHWHAPCQMVWCSVLVDNRGKSKYHFNSFGMTRPLQDSGFLSTSKWVLRSPRGDNLVNDQVSAWGSTFLVWPDPDLNWDLPAQKRTLYPLSHSGWYIWRRLQDTEIYTSHHVWGYSSALISPAIYVVNNLKNILVYALTFARHNDIPANAA